MIKMRKIPLLAFPQSGAKIEDSNLNGKSDGEFSPIPPSFLTGGVCLKISEPN